jgi:hypothetical protein
MDRIAVIAVPSDDDLLAKKLEGEDHPLIFKKKNERARPRGHGKVTHPAASVECTIAA